MSIFEHNRAMKEVNSPSVESTLFRARVDTDHYEQAKLVLNRLGLKPGDAVNLLFAQIALRKDLPFAVTANPSRVQSDEAQLKAWQDALGEY